MPPPSPPLHPAPARRARRAPVVAVLVTVMALGGAVAGVYGTGVVLGSRLAPSGDAAPPDRSGDEQAAGTTPGSGAETRSSGSTLPDRVTDRTGPDGRAPGPPSAPGSTPATDGGTASGSVGTEPFRAMWPYATWDEVQQHVLRGDLAFSSPEESALRFAREVIGSTDATVAGVDPRGDTAVVDLRAGGGPTFVTLERLDLPGTPAAASPWGVVSAAGDVDLRTAPAASGPTLDVAAVGAPATLAVSDRRSWRGVAAEGTDGVRLEPGPGGPALVVALAGDPRDPSSFAARRVQLDAGAGVAGPAAPADPAEAARGLAASIAAGDVAAVWDLLAPGAQAAVLDWRGLATRLPALRARLGFVSSVPLAVTTVATEAGSVAVVSPTASALTVPGVEPIALPFRTDGGGARLADVEGATATWTMGPTPDLIVAGPTRPTAVTVDGAAAAGEADGDRGLRVPLGALPDGDHLAVAVFVVGDVVSAAVHGFTTATEVAVPTETPVPEGSATTRS